MTGSNPQHLGDRLITLDGLRGVAAIMVVAYHAFGPSSGAIPGGYLAVDFFFILSGLVISKTYQSRLDNGQTFGAFMKARLVRLYPLLFLGLVLDALRCVLLVMQNKQGAFGLPEIAMSFGREMLLVPSSSRWELLFRINPPSWSLFMEIAVNCLFAVGLFRLRSRHIAGIVSVSLLALSILAVAAGTFDLGATWETALPGLLRSLVGFAVGMLIARASPAWPVPSYLSPLLGVALVAAMYMPSSLLLEGLCIAFLMPLLVVLGARFNPPTRLLASARLLGEVSYPMYAIHWGLIFPLQGVGRALHLPNTVANIGIVVIVFCCGFAASRLYEVPVRRALHRRLNRTLPAPGLVSTRS